MTLKTISEATSKTTKEQLPLSVTIITLNEQDQITNAINSVKWAAEILVVDSGSTDRTVEIATKLGAKVVQRPWPGYGQQKNFAQEQARFDWVLNLDADETIPVALAEEIAGKIKKSLSGEDVGTGFYCPRKTFYLGRGIKYGGWYPNYLMRLADRRVSHWTEPFVHEELKTRGAISYLKNSIHHNSFLSIRDQILTNLRLSFLGSRQLTEAGQRASIPKLCLKPVGKFIECYFIKLGFLDGLLGFIIAINAAHSIFLKHAFLFEDKLREKYSGEE